MKKITKMLLTILSISTILISSCTKPKDGQPGAAGPEGNANVKTVKFSVPLSGFIGPLADKEYSYPYALSTAGNVTIGEWDAVLLYMETSQVSSTDYYTQLPFNSYYNSGTVYNHVYFEHGSAGTGNVLNIYLRNSSGLQPYSSMTGYLSFKCVVIAGSQAIRAKVPQGVNLSTYEAAKNYFKLEN